MSSITRNHDRDHEAGTNRHAPDKIAGTDAIFYSGPLLCTIEPIRSGLFWYGTVNLNQGATSCTPPQKVTIIVIFRRDMSSNRPEHLF